MNLSHPESAFVDVNGIRLQYLDWHGRGETLIFLTGMGCSTHLFRKFALHFTDYFRVLALTRRGQGASDYPETGYDVDTLVDDIVKFMDTLQIDKAILVGHSMAGMELSHLAVTHPERVTKLVYLDAAYDRRRTPTEECEAQALEAEFIQSPNRKETYSSIEEYSVFVKSICPALEQLWDELWDQELIYELTKVADNQYVEKDNSIIEKAMFHTVATYEPEDSQIKIPVLSIFCTYDEPDLPKYLTAAQKLKMLECHKQGEEWKAKNISKFRSDVPHAKVVVIPNGHHFCFMSHENLVYEEMNRFLQAS